MKLLDRTRRRAERRGRATTALIRFCDACSQVITPGAAARRRREEAKHRSSSFLR